MDKRESFMTLNSTVCLFLAAALTMIAAPSVAVADEPAAEAEQVSFYQQVRPIFQAQCQGCHQPAKAGGEYVMTTFDRLFAGGESEELAIVPGKTATSHLIKLITPVDGEAEMPKGKKPLADTEIALIRLWIEQGAKDDTPARYGWTDYRRISPTFWLSLTTNGPTSKRANCSTTFVDWMPSLRSCRVPSPRRKNLARWTRNSSSFAPTWQRLANRYRPIPSSTNSAPTWESASNNWPTPALPRLKI